VTRTHVVSPALVRQRRTLAVREVREHRIVALIEILSPGNKAGTRPLAEFVEKATQALAMGIHLAVIDLFPPGRLDPAGIHGEIVSALNNDDAYELPENNPLTFVSYTAGVEPVAYLQHPSVGDEVPELPLFLTEERYVPLPLRETYELTFTRGPSFWREVIEGNREAPADE